MAKYSMVDMGDWSHASRDELDRHRGRLAPEGHHGTFKGVVGPLNAALNPLLVALLFVHCFILWYGPVGVVGTSASPSKAVTTKAGSSDELCKWLAYSGRRTWLCSSTVQLFDTLTFACLLCGTLLVTCFTLGTLWNFDML